MDIVIISYLDLRVCETKSYSPLYFQTRATGSRDHNVIYHLHEIIQTSHNLRLVFDDCELSKAAPTPLLNFILDLKETISKINEQRVRSRDSAPGETSLA